MPDLNIMSIPYGIFEEKRNSPRYNWNNDSRGDDPNVIFQYTLEGAGVFEINGVAHPVEPEHGFLAIKEARRLQRGARMPLKELALRTGFPSARQLGKYLG